MPNSAPDVVRLGLGLLVTLTVLAALRIIIRSKLSPGETGRRTPSFIKLLLLLIPVYGAFLVVSISLLDANTPLDRSYPSAGVCRCDHFDRLWGW